MRYDQQPRMRFYDVVKGVAVLVGRFSWEEAERYELRKGVSLLSEDEVRETRLNVLEGVTIDS
jgi:hypothetical protein